MDSHSSTNFLTNVTHPHGHDLSNLSHSPGAFNLDSTIGVFTPHLQLPTTHAHPEVSLFTPPSHTVMGSTPLHAESINCGNLPSGWNNNFGTTMHDYRDMSYVTYGSPTHSVEISGQGMHITPQTASTFKTTEYFCPLAPLGPTITHSFTGYGSR
jgi:hypothetical protein